MQWPPLIPAGVAAADYGIGWFVTCPHVGWAPRSGIVRVGLLAGCALLTTRAAHAQNKGWQGTAELSGNIWYGAAHTRVVSRT